MRSSPCAFKRSETALALAGQNLTTQTTSTTKRRISKPSLHLLCRYTRPVLHQIQQNVFTLNPEPAGAGNDALLCWGRAHYAASGCSGVGTAEGCEIYLGMLVNLARR